MKKRNLRPQQAAPVARETNTNSSLVEKEGIGAVGVGERSLYSDAVIFLPFAGDDAE
ncbi:anacyclamide/piricyclamide family prenylated cyclic peptide [Nostoc sp. UHCC 0702]|nr:anacyclamide/piricyclamide family prenylated cyclic peptide [Nostoc sp. UHCC 0702]